MFDQPKSPPRQRTAWGNIPSIAEDERGDVPGWVLITLMSAALVVLIWAIAGPALTTLFNRAITSVNII